MAKNLFCMISTLLVCIAISNGHQFVATTEVGPCFQRPDGFARDVSSCQHYFVCQNGRATRARCQNNLLFDAENEVCGWRDEVTCFQCPRTALFSTVSVPRTCNQFYRCWQGRATIHTCPNNLVFNPNNLQCGFLQGSGCQGDITLEQGCPARDRDEPVFLPDEFSCSTYHVCQNGMPIRQECGDDLHFNPSLGICDTPENANCFIQQHPADHENPIWGPTPDRESPQLPALPCPESGSGFVPHGNNCNAYFACSQHLVVPLNCASGLHYDHVRRTCDRPSNARCWSNENTPRWH